MNQASSGEPARDAAAPAQNRRRFSLLPLLLLLLALSDLRTELQLLFDHFTFTTLFTAISSHPLAMVVLVAQPSLWRRYGARR
jgi:hypothetical protein